MTAEPLEGRNGGIKTDNRHILETWRSQFEVFLVDLQHRQTVDGISKYNIK